MKISFIHVCDWTWLDVGLVQVMTCLKEAGHEVRLIDPTFKINKPDFIIKKT